MSRLHFINSFNDFEVLGLTVSFLIIGVKGCRLKINIWSGLKIQTFKLWQEKIIRKYNLKIYSLAHACLKPGVNLRRNPCRLCFLSKPMNGIDKSSLKNTNKLWLAETEFNEF